MLIRPTAPLRSHWPLLWPPEPLRPGLGQQEPRRPLQAQHGGSQGPPLSCERLASSLPVHPLSSVPFCWHGPLMAGTAGRTGDAESCSSGSPRGLQCFRAVFCPPPALCVPFCVCCSPEGQRCSGHSGGTFWSLSALGSGIRVLLVRKHSCWGLSWKKHRKKTQQFHPIGFHLSLPQLR